MKNRSSRNFFSKSLPGAGGLRLAAEPDQLKIGQLVHLLGQTDCVIDCDGRSCVLKGNFLLKLGLNMADKEFIRAHDQ